MSEFTFTRASKDQSKARIALDGPSGSGKTYTSLLIAAELGKKTAVIDTERGSASKYADEFDFDTLQMHSFDPRDLVKALASAGRAGYDVVCVDSLSHFWMGTGGMLEQVDNAAKRSGGGNSFAGWKEARPMERAMVDALLAYPGHVIVTMRTKTEWVVEENDRGRKVPRKIGLKPEQREGIEYEFDIVGDLDLENTLVVSKSRCRALSGAVIRRPDGDSFGKPVAAWVGGGAPVAGVTEYLAETLDPATTVERLRELHRVVSQRQLGGAAVEDEAGAAMTLIELIAARGQAAQRERATQQQAQQQQTPHEREVAERQAAPPPGETPIDERQLRHIHTILTNDTREDKLALVTRIVGRDITSTKQLTHTEAASVINELTRPVEQMEEAGA